MSDPASETQLDALFSALADPTRRGVLTRLIDGEASVAELTALFAMSQPAISKHLKVLEKAGLVSRGRDAQRRPVRVELAPVNETIRWLRDYRKAYQDRLDGSAPMEEGGKSSKTKGGKKKKAKKAQKAKAD